MAKISSRIHRLKASLWALRESLRGKDNHVRGERLARQWCILRALELNRHGITVANLAEQDGCHARTVWRDLAALREAGFPLYSEKADRRAGSVS